MAGRHPALPFGVNIVGRRRGTEYGVGESAAQLSRLRERLAYDERLPSQSDSVA